MFDSLAKPLLIRELVGCCYLEQPKRLPTTRKWFKFKGTLSQIHTFNGTHFKAITLRNLALNNVLKYEPVLGREGS